MTDLGTAPEADLPADLLEAFLESAQLLYVSEDPDETMLRLTTVACRTIESCAAASVSALENDAIRTIGATDPRAEQIDAIQYETQEGPCWVAATEQRRLVYTPDTCDDERWPVFSRRTAEEAGMNSLLACRLVVGDGPPRALGALNIYGEQPAAFDGADFHLAMLLAAIAATLLDAVHRQQHLRAAIESRGLIGQAMGILMAQSHITSDQAFDQLRSASQRLNVKLRDLARTIAESKGAQDSES